MFIVHTMEEIQGLLDAHEQFKATLGEADKEYQSIVGLVQQVESIAKQHSIPGGLDNPYTSLTAKVNIYPIATQAGSKQTPTAYNGITHFAADSHNHNARIMTLGLPFSFFFFHLITVFSVFIVWLSLTVFQN